MQVSVRHLLAEASKKRNSSHLPSFSLVYMNHAFKLLHLPLACFLHAVKMQGARYKWQAFFCSIYEASSKWLLHPCTQSSWWWILQSKTTLELVHSLQRHQVLHSDEVSKWQKWWSHCCVSCKSLDSHKHQGLSSLGKTPVLQSLTFTLTISMSFSHPKTSV